ncbi:putative regulator of chromatin subfamily A-like protein 1-like [Apostichopus japonicus]|uniref:Putative regulator of chromatin subfamily A-like protein 1-like n=1 Tax=Stichopus japonicus TaxID=307972 RepID=A0A2G8K8I7_STIJA|nr:putative regulator of chromatin subfamily A-like protein 1-like [Apostichopus japonicus]
MASLTSEQKHRIEQNRLRALQLKAQKHRKNNAPSGLVAPSAGPFTGPSTSIANSSTVSYNATKTSAKEKCTNSDVASSSGQFTKKQTTAHVGGTLSTMSGNGDSKTNVQTLSTGQFQSSRTSSSAAKSSNHSSFSNIGEVNQNAHMSGERRPLPESKSNPSSVSTFTSTKSVSQFYKKPLMTAGGNSTKSSGQILKNSSFASFERSSALTSSNSNGPSHKYSGSSTITLTNSRQASSSSSKSLKMFGQKQSTISTCVLVSSDRFEVNIPFRQDIIQCFQKMQSRSYDADKRKWTFAVTEYSDLMKALRSLQPPVEMQPLPSSVVKLFCNSTSRNSAIQDANLGSIDQILRDGLLPFQRDGVNFVIHHGGRALIADDMGLGKTIQAICIACYYRTEWPLLIVSPSSMRYSWAEAFEKWVPSLDPEDIHVVGSGQRKIDSGLVTIISYDLMSRRSKELAAQNYQAVVMDESHFLKNFKTARTRAAMPILKQAPRRILLSGTPALSRPSELYMQIQAIHSSLFPSFHEFALRYCDAKQNAWGWDYSGSSNLSELQLILERKIMIRRLKSDVLSQLPAKTRQKVIMDPKCIKTKGSTLKSLATAAKKEKANRNMILAYYAETARLKIPAVRAYVEDLLEGDKKFLIFAHHQDMMDALCEACDTKKVGYIRIDGSTPPQQRFKFCEDFQTKDKYRVAVLSIMAANSGITLTAASLVLFAELFWNPGILMQAEDRAHRIGQSDAVFIHYLIGKGTADDLLCSITN